MSDDKIIFLNSGDQELHKQPSEREHIECSMALATELEMLAAMARRGELIGGAMAFVGADLKTTYGTRCGVMAPAMCFEMDILKHKMMEFFTSPEARVDV